MSMRSTGITRKVDELGRVVLPKSIRDNLNIEEKDPLEIFVDGNRIILQKYEPSCILCGNAENIVLYRGKRVCEDCIENLKKTF